LNGHVSEGLLVVVVALAAALLFAGARAVTDGRFRGTRRVRGTAQAGEQTGGGEVATVLDGSGLEPRLGERATLLQFSSAFCAPCRATRRVLAEVAAIVPGVNHVEVDAEHHLDLVRRLGIARTPTTLVLDAHGREVSRASGAPKRDEVLATLARDLA